MKIKSGNGWFSIRPSGLKLEVTYFDGTRTFCENIKTRDWGSAADYCRERIGGSL